MSFISLDRRFIFIHVQRTGGTSISEVLQANSLIQIKLPPHPSALDVRDEWQCLWRRFFTIGTVRNPWDLWVSWFHWNGEWHGRYPTFRDFMLDYKTWYHDPAFGFRDPWSALCDASGCPLVDYVIRYERIQEGFDEVCQHVGIAPRQLPHAGKTDHGPYRDYYDDRTRDIVAEISEPTIRSFNYAY